MRADVASVGPDTELEVVVAGMWRDKRGAVLVVEERQLLGIFTRSDALRALVELLAEHPPEPLLDEVEGGVGLPTH
jgi:CBS domain-containing protein